MRHECPDCGHVHEMKAEERIRRLEAEIARLKASQHVCHGGCYHWYPVTITSGTTWTQPNVVTYSLTSGD